MCTQILGIVTPAYRWIGATQMVTLTEKKKRLWKYLSVLAHLLSQITNGGILNIIVAKLI